MKRVLILGVTGMAGHLLAMYLNENKFDVYGYSRKKINYCKNINGDIKNIIFLKEMIDSINPNYIINCLGVLNTACDDDVESAIYVNSLLPHIIENYIKDKKMKLIHLSTDCVFSGESGKYEESSYHDGKSLYDKTKSLGEVKNGKSLTLRNSIIGPDINEAGIGLFNWFMRQKNEINGYSNVYWNGITTLELAKAIKYIIEQNDITGVYHFVPDNNISKYNLCKLFNKYFKNNGLIINEYKDISMDKTLVNTRKDLGIIPLNYEDQIRELKEWVNNHKDLYKHYF